MPTKSEMEMVLPMMKDAPDDIRKKLQDLKPIENLDMEDFARHLAIARNKPEEYSGIIKGFFKRWKLSRETKAVGLLDTYLQRIRLASDSAAQLQETILKNRIVFIFQVQFAQDRLQRQWALEKKGYDHQEVLLDMNIAKAQAFTRFYNTADLSNLSETALILLNMTTERYSTSSFNSSSASPISSSAAAFSASVQYGSPEEITRSKREEKLMEALMGERLADTDKKKADVNHRKEEVRRESIKANHEDLKFRRDRDKPLDI